MSRLILGAAVGVFASMLVSVFFLLSPADTRRFEERLDAMEDRIRAEETARQAIEQDARNNYERCDAMASACLSKIGRGP